MKIQTNWHVITGGPSSGKTTIIKELRLLGYNIIHETARFIIEKELKRGKTLNKIRENDGIFQKKIVQIKIKLENMMPVDSMVFFDTGLPCGIAYCKVNGNNPDYIIKASQKKKYKKVFLLEQLPIFEKDHARTENQKLALKINKFIYQAYTDLGYDVIGVPVMLVHDRVQFIVQKL